MEQENKVVFPSSVKVYEERESGGGGGYSGFRKKREIVVVRKDIMGQVKWFNRRAGYGFLVELSAEGESSKTMTTTEEEAEGAVSVSDFFVHYRGIVNSLPVDREKPQIVKYLNVGEQVVFDLIESQQESSKFAYQAWNVRKADGGPLSFEIEQRQYTPSPSSSHRTYNNVGRSSAPSSSSPNPYRNFSSSSRSSSSSHYHSTPTPSSSSSSTGRWSARESSHSFGGAGGGSWRTKPPSQASAPLPMNTPLR